MKKIAIISTSLPPFQSGQSSVLYHLLKTWDPQEYCLITQKNVSSYSDKTGNLEKLPANYYFLKPDSKITSIIIYLAVKIKFILLLQAMIKLRSFQMKKILQKENCDSVIVCTGDLFDAPSAMEASRSLKIPYIFYAFDDYSFQWTDPFLHVFAGMYEQDCIGEASRVIVPNEFLAEEYLRRYGIETTVIHNPVDINQYENDFSPVNNTDARRKNEIAIVYTGSVYEAQYDAFYNLITAVELLDIPNLKIHVYSQQAKSSNLQSINKDFFIIHDAIPANEIPQIQKEASILFLPLAFRSSFPDVIRTSAPGKIGEYLASKTPILVHAPENSYISWYFTKYQCGIVVDKDDPRLLANAIMRILSDRLFTQTISRNAYIRLKTDFDLEVISKQFHFIFKK